MGHGKCAEYIGGVAAAALMVVPLAVQVSTAAPEVKLSADSTALLVCGTTCTKWGDADVDRIMNQFVMPTHPPESDGIVTPVAVTAPGEAWPITGIFRLLGLALGDPSFFGPGGAAWPDAPWWKLSGLFDLTTNQSVQAGVAALEAAVDDAPDEDPLIVYGYSQGAVIANQFKRKLAERFPVDGPDIRFVLGGDFSVPNGGLHARFPGLYVPILDWTFDGPEPTNTTFHTDVISVQYDGVADFPLYPLNLIADLNALLGFLYVHSYPFDVSLPAEPSTSPTYRGTHGDSSYYFFETQDLPLFGPLRTLGVPESMIDVIEPFFRVIVELGYDRSIPLWEPTPARLIPRFDPAKVIAELVDAISEGLTNALTLLGSPIPPPAPSIPATSTADIPDSSTSQETPAAGGQPSSMETTISARTTPTEPQEPATVTDIGGPTAPQPTTDADEATVAEDNPVSAAPRKDTDNSDATAESTKSTTTRPLVRDSLRADEALSESVRDDAVSDSTSSTDTVGDATTRSSTDPSSDSPSADSESGDNSDDS